MPPKPAQKAPEAVAGRHSRIMNGTMAITHQGKKIDEKIHKVSD
jgi:hypothetical protein